MIFVYVCLFVFLPKLRSIDAPLTERRKISSHRLQWSVPTSLSRGRRAKVSGVENILGGWLILKTRWNFQFDGQFMIAKRFFQDHCDFTTVQNLLWGQNTQDLIESTHQVNGYFTIMSVNSIWSFFNMTVGFNSWHPNQVHYENFRCRKLLGDEDFKKVKMPKHLLFQS